MNAAFSEALGVMERAFRRLEASVPPPKAQRLGRGYVFRYEEQSIEQAIVQKVARKISTLAAAQLLLDNGFVQEQAAMQRILDELGEDITFLVAAITNDSITELHERYLKAFYEEEFGNPDDIVASSMARDLVPRKKIRAYLARVLGGNDPSRHVSVSAVISRTYSGYVHGASPQIMDMCGGSPPRFHLFGMRGTIRIEEHERDAWNYYYRSLLDITAAAKAFGDSELVDQLYKYIEEFQDKTGIAGGFRRHAQT